MKQPGKMTDIQLRKNHSGNGSASSSTGKFSKSADLKAVPHLQSILPHHESSFFCVQYFQVWSILLSSSSITPCPVACPVNALLILQAQDVITHLQEKAEMRYVALRSKPTSNQTPGSHSDDSPGDPSWSN